MALLGGCGTSAAAPQPPAPSAARRLDLEHLKAHPGAYPWLEFRPNVKKLILAGAEDTEHVAILWYPLPGGSVGRHQHSKTESVFVIEGAQTDAQGTYRTGTAYFNPPGSGHQISNSTGLFILAYASPPDFASTGSLEAYTPLRVDTAAPDLASTFEPLRAGVRALTVPLDTAGGMSAQLIELCAPQAELAYIGNYLLVLDGSCEVDGVASARGTLLVADGVAPRPYALAAPRGERCLLMGVSF